VTFGPSWARAMNWETWNSLPPDIQEVFENNMKVWSLEQIWEVNREKERGIDFAMGLGHEFLHLSPEELNTWYDLLKANALEQVAKIEAKGVPGNAMFNDARSLIEKYSL
jgi:TRAP-type C4-dicarboxylate transport system substrate-binding protein